VTEIHPQAEAFIATLAERLTRGAAFFIDYGFPRRVLPPAAPRRHADVPPRAPADTDPLADVGEKDITAHVDFTGIALAAQDAGLEVLGYTTQARFLMNCGLLDAAGGADLPTIAHAQKLLNEHEMGELFKVIGFAKGLRPVVHRRATRFCAGDRNPYSRTRRLLITPISTMTQPRTGDPIPLGAVKPSRVEEAMCSRAGPVVEPRSRAVA
jgi:SAM-dependent MidA family methyltransferase